jgi:hypothetical protein
MGDEAAILAPDREVKIGDEKVTVRELKWSEGRAFLKQMTNYLGGLFDEKGEVQVNAAGVAKLITETEELIESLITKSTGKDAQFIGNLQLGQIMALLEVALELNLFALIEKGKAMAGRFRGVTQVDRPT